MQKLTRSGMGRAKMGAGRFSIVFGSSKLFVERMLADVNVAYGLPWMALRYFNAAGADPDGQIGEAHDPATHLISL